MLALLDLSMPGMDGLELAGRISRRPTLAGLELLLLTSVPDVTAEEARANGISVRLTKPVQLSRLHAAIQEALGCPSVPDEGRRLLRWPIRPGAVDTC